MCVSLSSAVQGPRVPILPSALWNYAVWSDPRTAGRAAQVLPPHRIGVPDNTVFGTRSDLWHPDFPWCLGAAASASPRKVFSFHPLSEKLQSPATESKDFLYDGTNTNPARPALDNQPIQISNRAPSAGHMTRPCTIGWNYVKHEDAECRYCYSNAWPLRTSKGPNVFQKVSWHYSLEKGFDSKRTFDA